MSLDQKDPRERPLLSRDSPRYDAAVIGQAILWTGWLVQRTAISSNHPYLDRIGDGFRQLLKRSLRISGSSLRTGGQGNPRNLPRRRLIEACHPIASTASTLLECPVSFYPPRPSPGDGSSSRRILPGIWPPKDKAKDRPYVQEISSTEFNTLAPTYVRRMVETSRPASNSSPDGLHRISRREARSTGGRRDQVHLSSHLHPILSYVRIA